MLLRNRTDLPLQPIQAYWQSQQSSIRYGSAPELCPRPSSLVRPPRDVPRQEATIPLSTCSRVVPQRSQSLPRCQRSLVVPAMSLDLSLGGDQLIPPRLLLLLRSDQPSNLETGTFQVARQRRCSTPSVTTFALRQRKRSPVHIYVMGLSSCSRVIPLRLPFRRSPGSPTKEELTKASHVSRTSRARFQGGAC